LACPALRPADRLGGPEGTSFAAFPSWFLRLASGATKAVMHNRAHFMRSYLPLSAILHRTQHVGVGGASSPLWNAAGASTRVTFRR
jgi:hypothetical protein